MTIRQFITPRRVVRFCLFAILFFTMGFCYKFYVPRLEAWLLIKIKQQSKENMPAHIVPESLAFNLFPLGVILENVDVIPKMELKAFLAPTRIGQVGATLNLLSLLKGQVRLSSVYLRHANVSIFLNTDDLPNSTGANSATTKAKKKFDFETLYQLPVDEIHLEDVVIQGKISPQNFVFRSEAIDLTIENRYRSLLVELNIPKVMIKPSGPTRPIVVQMQARTLIESREAQISAFKLKADDSYLVASGRINGEFGNGEISNSAFNARAHVSLPDIAYWLETLTQLKKAPKLLGTVDFDLGIDSQREKATPLIEYEFSGEGVQIDKYIVGTIKAKGSGDLKNLQMPMLTVTNNAGSASLKNTVITHEQNWSLKTILVAQKVELGQLLKNIGVKAPVKAEISGSAPCTGVYSDKPELSCQAQVTGNKMLVTSGAPKNTVIVEADALQGDGSFTLDKSEVKFKSNLKLGAKSVGKTDGVVNYHTGFKINFEAEPLDAKDIKNLANLKLEGLLTLKGHTEGTSDWGTVTMNASGTDVWLEDYPLGALTSEVTYKAGHLTFSKAQGQYGVTRYAGQVAIDLTKDRMEIEGQMPFIDLKDVFSLFQRKTELVLPVSGTGTGTVKAWGPFNFRKMSYEMKSSFFRGSAFEETFDKLIFNVSSVDGNVKSDLIQMQKANGDVNMVGTINPEAVINAKIVGRKLRLEQSENIMNFGLDLQGQTDFIMDLKGELPRPAIELNGHLSQMILAEKPVDDSNFKLNIYTNRIEGSGNFMGSVIETTFNIPLENQGPFALKIKSKKWDFTNAFSLLSRSAQQLDFETLLSMEANLQSPSGGFWNSSGDVRISEFAIRKGPSAMRAEKPMYLTFNNGQISAKDFEITSGDSYLRLESHNLTRSNLSASLNGKMDLSLLGLLTPFISDLRGNLAVSVDLKGSVEKPNVSGSAYIEKGYVKLRDFPHPFSAIRADLLFNQTQIVVNALRADFAGGKTSGEGRIEFMGADNIPVDMRGIFSDINLNFPEGFHSKGSGQIAIRGSQFPYLMQIHYDVTGGEIISEFTGGNNGSTVKASAYLPKFIYNESFHPFSMLVDIVLKNPISVNNSMVQAQVTGQVKAAGVPDRLSLTGTFTPLPGGKAFFNETPFEIVTGYVEFENSPPDNPKLYMMANTTVFETVSKDSSHQEENQYDINLLVQGRGKNPQLTLTSQPPLSQKEIVSLLALGLTPEAFDQSRKGNTGTSTSTAIGNALLQKPVSKKLRDTFGVDVKLSSSQATQETASTPKVTFSKQWTPKFGVSASGTLESNPTSDVKLEYKVKRGTSVIGSWEGKEQGATQKTKDTSKSVFGLDLEYKVNFK